MEFAVSDREVVIIGSGIITVVAVLLAIIYTMRKQRALGSAASPGTADAARKQSSSDSAAPPQGKAEQV